MTKEELEKEAEEWLNKWDLCNKCENKVDCISNFSYCKKVVLQSYLASAEPREKQIEIDAEQIRALQKQNGELTDEFAKKADINHQLVEQMAKLSEENAELKQAKEGKVVEHFEAYGQCRDSRRIAELEAQINKMKMCEICKHYQGESCNYHSYWVKDCKENGMKLFELKEIKEK